MFQYGNVLMRADASVVFVFLFAYCLATIGQSFLISVFFSRANLAAACAGIIFFVLYLPYPFMVRWMLYLSSTDKVLLSLFSNVAFGLGASYLSLYEERGTGLHWGDVGASPLYDDTFNLLYVVYMLILDFVLYLILTWYIEAVFPGQYGIPKPWYFPLTISYWSGKPVRKIYVDQFGEYSAERDYGGGSVNTFEDEPIGLNKGVVISNLSKVYGDGKVAVDDISLNFYEGQITSFLGHNGAGKTTTISILTGLFPPSRGSAKIYGLDIRTDMDKIRNSLGMCPQHNVLFDRLTVEEHLYFYGRLRGGGSKTDSSLIAEEGERMLDDLGLPHKRKALASDLSGGMQRKLSIAVAFIGGSKTVILDEPTSGVDPYSRRSIWELLLKYKRGRTVILTTHYMDEADLLSDRIAIMANGKLQCCGSSVFLKSIYGSGYHLTVEMRINADKLPPTTEFDGDGDISDVYHPHVVALNKHIKEFVGQATLAGQIGSEVTFVLPPRHDFTAFTALCDSLDSNLAKLNILNYGISDTSLEEIFLKVAEQNDPAMRGNVSRVRVSYLTKLFRWLNKRKNNPLADASVKSEPHNSKIVEKEIVVHLNGANVKYTPVSVWDGSDRQPAKKDEPNAKWRQFMALHTKRFNHTRRNRKALFSELILPAIFVCMSLAVTSIFPALEERPPLDIEPWLYPRPRFIFYEDGAPDEMESYVDGVKGPQGLGSLCVLIDGKRNSQCVEPSTVDGGDADINMTAIECSCDTGAQVCPASIGEQQPPYTKIASGDTLYDMTGRNISNWIVNTWPRYAQHRYGGYSFGVEGIVPNVDVDDITRRLLEIVEGANPSSIFEIFDTLTSDRKPSRNNIKVWFNNKGWVSSVAYMSAINNVVLRASLPANVSAQYGIRTINHPMNFTEKQLEIELIKQAGVSLLHAISVIFALSFVPASFTLYIIEERTSTSKHLQLVSGVAPWIYWLQAYTWDMACYIVSALLCVFIFLIFNEEAYVSSTNLPGLLLLFLLYGWSCIPLMYPVSYLFSIPSSAFVGLACANMFVGIITTVTTFVLGTFDDEELRAVDDVIKEVFLVFPHFCLGDGLMKLAANHMASASLSSLDIEWSANILEWDFIGKNLFCMFVLGIVFFAVTLMTEYGCFTSLLRTTYEPTAEESANGGEVVEDDDVKAERLRIEEGSNTSDILIIDKLTKVYRKRGLKKPSVNRISVGVKQGECFGLLGLNGAGKTSTFKMLTGAIKATSGDAYVKGYSVTTDINRVRSLIGYCPQFDALDPLLTPREHLQFYARVRNIRPALLQKRVDGILEELGLGHYSDRLAGTLSGGNKRKLSTAIALIGNPPLVFLDEPTSGMDPKSRRFLWSRIQESVRRGSCVVLTTHSMEECQALCTTITIMVNGRFTCIGTSQHLKNKFGGGYSIVIRCDEQRLAALKAYIGEKLPDSQLTESHYNQVRYGVASSSSSSSSSSKLSSLFARLEEARRLSLIDDYSLSQTTLEEVFIRFANEQTEPETVGGELWPMLRRCLVCSRNRNR